MARKIHDVCLDPIQVQLKVLPGVREKLKSIDGWQEKLRSAIDRLIAEESN